MPAASAPPLACFRSSAYAGTIIAASGKDGAARNNNIAAIVPVSATNASRSFTALGIYITVFDMYVTAIMYAGFAIPPSTGADTSTFTTISINSTAINGYGTAITTFISSIVIACANSCTNFTSIGMDGSPLEGDAAYCSSRSRTDSWNTIMFRITKSISTISRDIATFNCKITISFRFFIIVVRTYAWSI